VVNGKNDQKNDETNDTGRSYFGFEEIKMVLALHTEKNLVNDGQI